MREDFPDKTSFYWILEGGRIWAQKGGKSIVAGGTA